MQKAVFGLIGTGWRGRHFLRIAQELPDYFEVGAILTRNPEKASSLEKTWKAKAYCDLDSFLKSDSFLFVVVATGESNHFFIRKLAQQGVPVLSETPPASNIDDLLALSDLTKSNARIQVAEQYQFQPLLAAQLAVIASGKLGVISQAQVSVAHGFHGVSLIRKILGVAYDNAAIWAKTFTCPVIAGPGRNGLPIEETMVDSTQTIAQLDFNGKLGLLDFDPAQYSGWIRSPRTLVRGHRGEINNRTVRYLKDFRTPVRIELLRQDVGQENSPKEGLGHKGISAGHEYVYTNPFGPVRLTDDELATATCLAKMTQYVQSGKSFYSLAQALQDTYLSFVIDQAIKTGQTITTQTQPWAQS